MPLLPALLLVITIALGGTSAHAAAAPVRSTVKATPKAGPTLDRSPRDVAAMTAREKRCYVRINQPAASVLLNRSTAPRAICVQSCEAKLIGPRRRGGRIAALTLYTGRACRLPAATPKSPPTRIAKTRPRAPRGG